MGRNAGGRSGTLAPAASLVLLRGRGRMAELIGRKHERGNDPLKDNNHNNRRCGDERLEGRAEKHRVGSD